MLVALTGGIGSGKSTVAHLFAQHGAIVIRADDLAREVIAEGGKAHAAVLAHFGESIIGRDGKIDRTKLAEIVFNDKSELETLEQITHPAIAAQLASIVEVTPKDKVIIYEVPLLIEKNLFNKFDKSIAVIAELELRKERVRSRDLTETEFAARVANQTTDEQRETMVDFVIHNNGSLSQLAEQVDRTWNQLTS